MSSNSSIQSLPDSNNISPSSSSHPDIPIVYYIIVLGSLMLCCLILIMIFYWYHHRNLVKLIHTASPKPHTIVDGINYISSNGSSTTSPNSMSSNTNQNLSVPSSPPNQQNNTIEQTEKPISKSLNNINNNHLPPNSGTPWEVFAMNNHSMPNLLAQPPPVLSPHIRQGSAPGSHTVITPPSYYNNNNNNHNNPYSTLPTSPPIPGYHGIYRVYPPSIQNMTYNAGNNNLYGYKRPHKTSDISIKSGMPDVVASDARTALTEVTASSSGKSIEEDEENYDSVSTRMARKKKRKNKKHKKKKHRKYKEEENNENHKNNEKDERKEDVKQPNIVIEIDVENKNEQQNVQENMKSIRKETNSTMISTMISNDTTVTFKPKEVVETEVAPTILTDVTSSDDESD